MRRGGLRIAEQEQLHRIPEGMGGFPCQTKSLHHLLTVGLKLGIAGKKTLILLSRLR